MDGLRPGNRLAGKSLYGKSGPESWFPEGVPNEDKGACIKILGPNLDRSRFFMIPICTVNRQAPAVLGNPWIPRNPRNFQGFFQDYPDIPGTSLGIFPDSWDAGDSPGAFPGMSIGFRRFPGYTWQSLEYTGIPKEGGEVLGMRKIPGKVPWVPS